MTDEARAILEKLPALLREHPSLRGELYVLLEEHFPTRRETERILDELRAMREASEQRWEENRQQWEENRQRWEASDRRFEALLEETRQGFVRMDERFAALGSRWGIQTEEAVRGFAREFITTEFGGEVEHWRQRDAELDVVIRDGRTCLIEVTSWCDEAKLRRFIRNAALYAEITGRAVSRRLVVTAHATGTAWKLALAEGVEVISG